MISKVINETLKLKKKFSTYEELLSEYNVEIYTRNFEGIYGYTNFLPNGRPMIVYNNNLSEVEKTFVILHEIGHIIFHDNTARAFSKIDIHSSREETEADLFAVLFGDFRYCDSTNWIIKRINYINANHLNVIGYAKII